MVEEAVPKTEWKANCAETTLTLKDWAKPSPPHEYCSGIYYAENTERKINPLVIFPKIIW